MLNFAACKRNVNSQVTKYFASNGKVESICNFINDTIEIGTSRYYYENGNIKDSIEYNKGKKEGWQKSYYKNGTIESKIYFKNDLVDGKSYRYHENGKLKAETFWIRDKQYGDGYFYYSNGTLKLYNCLESFGENIYAVKYDSLGNKTKEEGIVFSPNFLLLYTSDTIQVPVFKNTIKKNKEIVIKFTIAQPPQTKTTIKMGELNKNLIDLPIEVYTATYTQSYAKPGTYTLLTVGEIKDLKGNILKRDSIITAIVVKD